MAVPTNEYLSLDDVCVELYQRHIQSGDTLLDAIAFADSCGGTWDPNYVGSKNSLLNFRGFVQYSFSRSPDRLDYDINGGGQSAYTTSNLPDIYVETPASWCSITPTHVTYGSGNQTYTITCDYNSDGSDRSTMVYFKNGAGEVLDAIYIYQTAY